MPITMAMWNSAASHSSSSRQSCRYPPGVSDVCIYQLTDGQASRLWSPVKPAQLDGDVGQGAGPVGWITAFGSDMVGPGLGKPSLFGVFLAVLANQHDRKHNYLSSGKSRDSSLLV